MGVKKKKLEKWVLYRMAYAGKFLKIRSAKFKKLKKTTKFVCFHFCFNSFPRFFLPVTISTVDCPRLSKAFDFLLINSFLFRTTWTCVELFRKNI